MIEKYHQSGHSKHPVTKISEGKLREQKGGRIINSRGLQTPHRNMVVKPLSAGSWGVRRGPIKSTRQSRMYPLVRLPNK